MPEASMRQIVFNYFLLYLMHKLRYPLTLFFDGTCPLCAAEMRQLRALDTAGRLCFADIYDEDFVARYPHIDVSEADRYLHGEFADGSMIYGLDVTCCAWRAVGRKPWLVILRWPLICWFADIAYRLFARNRYAISYLLVGERRCERCDTFTDVDSRGRR